MKTPDAHLVLALKEDRIDMPDRRQWHLFATRADLLRAGAVLDLARELSYALCGAFPTADVPSYKALADLPDLGVHPTGNQTTGACYLVLRAGARVAIDKVRQRDGKTRYSVNQMLNPDSIVLWPGGVFGDGCLVCGHIGTASASRATLELYRTASTVLLRSFAKIKSYFVGPEASRLLDSGWRLVTISVRSPQEYDLRRD